LIQTHTQQNQDTVQPSQTSSTSGSWLWGYTSSLFDKTIDKVKQQSEHIISIYKEDLQEFTQTIHTDTKEVIKKLPQDQEKFSELLGITTKKGVIQKSRLISLQSELSTYCTDPIDVDKFQAFKSEFQIASRTEEISLLLSTNDKVREIHTKLVPATVSYKEFWERYFFKLNLLRQEESRRAALVKKSNNWTR